MLFDQSQAADGIILTPKGLNQLFFCCHGTDDEGEVIVLIRHQVFLPRPGSPGVHTAESHLPLLDVNLRQRSLDEVARVTTHLLILHRPVVEVGHEESQRAGLHHGIGVELQSPTLAVEHTEPAHIGVVA